MKMRAMVLAALFLATACKATESKTESTSKMSAEAAQAINDVFKHLGGEKGKKRSALRNKRDALKAKKPRDLTNGEQNALIYIDQQLALDGFEQFANRTASNLRTGASD